MCCILKVVVATHFGNPTIQKKIVIFIQNPLLTKWQNFRLVQMEGICRQQNKCYTKTDISFGRDRKHCWVPLFPQLGTGGLVVSVSDSRPGGCEFDPRLRRLFFLVYFRLSPLQKHVRKVVGAFGKKSCVSTGVRKPGNTYASPPWYDLSC